MRAFSAVCGFFATFAQKSCYICKDSRPILTFSILKTGCKTALFWRFSAAQMSAIPSFLGRHRLFTSETWSRKGPKTGVFWAVSGQSGCQEWAFCPVFPGNTVQKHADSFGVQQKPAFSEPKGGSKRGHFGQRQTRWRPETVGIPKKQVKTRKTVKNVVFRPLAQVL